MLIKNNMFDKKNNVSNIVGIRHFSPLSPLLRFSKNGFFRVAKVADNNSNVAENQKIVADNKYRVAEEK